MRLRPYGESGPLAVSVLRARAVPGHAGPRVGALRLAQGARADRDRGTTSSQRSSRPFVFRKYLDFDAYDGLRDVHRQIREQGRRNDYAPNIKLGPGRHPRNRVHRAGAADRPRRARAGAAGARNAAGARRHRRARAAARRPVARCATPTSFCATSSTGCSTATTARRSRCPTTPPSARRSPRPWRAAGRASFEATLARIGPRSPSTSRSLFGDAGAAHPTRRRRRGRGDGRRSVSGLRRRLARRRRRRHRARDAGGGRLRRSGRPPGDARARARERPLPAAAGAVAAALRRTRAAAAAPRRPRGGSGADAADRLSSACSACSRR